jgi:GDSL-like Lipase/Acylhydrolase family
MDNEGTRPHANSGPCLEHVGEEMMISSRPKRRWALLAVFGAVAIAAASPPRGDGSAWGFPATAPDATVAARPILRQLAAIPDCDPRIDDCPPSDDDVQGPPGAQFNWKQADRYFASWAAWSTNRDRYRRDYVHPDGYIVDLDACGSSGSTNPNPNRPNNAIASYRWEINGPGRAVRPASVNSGCRFWASFPAIGRYDVRLIVTDDHGKTFSTERDVRIREDLVIVSLGDSNASGEGNINPDDHWSDWVCHRSFTSGPALAAERLEINRAGTVTFLSLACSGAKVSRGLLRSYAGQENNGTPLDPQVDVMEEMLCPSGPDSCRDVDAILVSAGVNDLGFADIISHCAADSAIFDDCSEDIEFVGKLNQRFLGLDELYDALGDRLDEGPLADAKIYITEYPDDPFDGEGGCGFLRKINDDEGAWLHRQAVRLNQEIRSAAARNGWNYVGGIADGFRGHGYCADHPWFVGLGDSVLKQENPDGTLHPNRSGHSHTAARLVDALEAGTPDRTPVAEATVTFEDVHVAVSDFDSELDPQNHTTPIALMVGSLEDGVGVEQDSGTFPTQGASMPYGEWVKLPAGNFTFTVPLAKVHELRIRAVTSMPGATIWSPKDRDYVAGPTRTVEAEARFGAEDGFGDGTGQLDGTNNGARLRARYRINVHAPGRPWQDPLAPSPGGKATENAPSSTRPTEATRGSATRATN